MSYEHIQLKGLSEVEAALLLCAATVVADRTIDPRELDEFTTQVEFLSDVISAGLSDRQISIGKLQALMSQIGRGINGQLTPFTEDEIKNISRVITDDEFKYQIMNSIIDISFSDNNYHDTEKRIVSILQQEWNV